LKAIALLWGELWTMAWSFRGANMVVCAGLCVRRMCCFEFDGKRCVIKGD
jgi:hypothetical protein